MLNTLPNPSHPNRNKVTVIFKHPNQTTPQKITIPFPSNTSHYFRSDPQNHGTYPQNPNPTKQRRPQDKNKNNQKQTPRNQTRCYNLNTQTKLRGTP
jgi:hypothetical protein